MIYTFVHLMQQSL